MLLRIPKTVSLGVHAGIREDGGSAFPIAIFVSWALIAQGQSSLIALAVRAATQYIGRSTGCMSLHDVKERRP